MRKPCRNDVPNEEPHVLYLFLTLHKAYHVDTPRQNMSQPDILSEIFDNIRECSHVFLPFIFGKERWLGFRLSHRYTPRREANNLSTNPPRKILKLMSHPLSSCTNRKMPRTIMSTKRDRKSSDQMTRAVEAVRTKSMGFTRQLKVLVYQELL
ncbi:unnamed protein product [Acanthoscelides obtectus]|uniref:Uncharacterized protein n=1 Tax=Acanthoscelides obtectus TaxID=200917 RepID=A0A9P0PAX6_ACAOB|nr:unnamed protein product [Acanthoscelides obtectus]CAK1654501.1 hypothetical protein AOBTE_LOCUS18642 [Acanthoscelides obtectus]